MIGIHITIGTIAWCFSGLVFLYHCIRIIRTSRAIACLGARAPSINRLPFGIDGVYQIINDKEIRKLGFWQSKLKPACGASELRSTLTTAEFTVGTSDRFIFTTDPENIKAMLSTQFADYGKGESFHRSWNKVLSNCIFASDWELWSRTRNLIQPIFEREHIVDTELFEKHLQKLIRLLRGSEYPSQSEQADMQSLFVRYTIDVFMDYLLGKDTDSLGNQVRQNAHPTRKSGFFTWGLSFRSKSRDLYDDLRDVLQLYIQVVLSRTTEELSQKLSRKDTFLEALARLTRDPRVLCDQLIAMLIAGPDTTASSLTFCMFELSRNPEVVAKLRSEIGSRLGIGSDGRKPTYVDLKEMNYLSAVINETLRLYPAVPFNWRVALHNTTLPRGGCPDGLSPVGVPQGTEVMYSTMLMQRRADLYPTKGHPGYFDPLK